MKSKHTPGPWAVKNGHIIGETRYGKRILAASWAIRSYGIDPDLIEEAEANAVLIASAPELLANLKGLLAWIESARAQDKSRPHMPDVGYLQSAYDAIACAEGGIDL